MRNDSLVAGGIIVLIAGGLFTADYVLKERPHAMEGEEIVATDPNINSSAGAVSSAASSSAFVKKGTSTKKAMGVNIEAVLAQLQLISTPTTEASLITLTAPDPALVQTRALLKNNDRAFLLSWIEHDDVKGIFAALKQALQAQFSPQVSDLVDETRTPHGGAVVDVLTFLDPAISTEKIIFLRVRNRLYELHIAQNGASLADQLIAELSK
jgi:hypothetical protein